jgi:hypothetical protein
MVGTVLGNASSGLLWSRRPRAQSNAQPPKSLRLFTPNALGIGHPIPSHPIPCLSTTSLSLSKPASYCRSCFSSFSSSSSGFLLFTNPNPRSLYFLGDISLSHLTRLPALLPTNFASRIPHLRSATFQIRSHLYNQTFGSLLEG